MMKKWVGVCFLYFYCLAFQIVRAENLTGFTHNFQIKFYPASLIILKYSFAAEYQISDKLGVQVNICFPHRGFFNPPGYGNPYYFEPQIRHFQGISISAGPKFYFGETENVRGWFDLQGVFGKLSYQAFPVFLSEDADNLSKMVEPLRFSIGGRFLLGATFRYSKMVCFDLFAGLGFRRTWTNERQVDKWIYQSNPFFVSRPPYWSNGITLNLGVSAGLNIQALLRGIKNKSRKVVAPK